MPSKEEICSTALGYLGQNPIEDINDAMKPNAVRCRQLYATSRDACLRDYEWGFATKRVTLQASAEAPEFGPLYRFVLPSDYLRAQSVNSDLYPYSIEDGHVLTNYYPCELKYTARVTEDGKFDSSFTESFALKLAAALAMPVLKKASAAQYWELKYQESLPRAKQADSNESRPDRSFNEALSGWLAAR